MKPIRISCSTAANLDRAIKHLTRVAKDRGGKAEVRKGPDHTATIRGVPAPAPYRDLTAEDRAAIDKSPICRIRNVKQSQQSD